MLWEVDIYPRPGLPNRAAESVSAAAGELGLGPLQVVAACGYLIEGRLSREKIERLAAALLVDDVVERAIIGAVGDACLAAPPPGQPRLVHVLPKPGVMDPVAQSAIDAMADLGIRVDAVRTLKKYWLPEMPDAKLRLISQKILANDAIEQVIAGTLTFDRLQIGAAYRFELRRVPIRELDDAALALLSRQRQLYLQLAEMQTIQAEYRRQQRDPTDAELETLAQTWSEHCSHKTLAGAIAYRGPLAADGPVAERRFENMLRETIFAATEEIRRQQGAADWCVSVFKDNAGVIRFDDKYHVVFKVETHNHPSALEPYGGANTGLGGVIRDPLGTGLGARPIANTDVFCFADPATPADALPPGVLHPKRVMKGVVSGVRDYGNRMGIPTVNGAIYFDPRYLGNPLVFCGDVGLLPCDKARKEPRPGDHIVAVGGRTGRDGIHGATFSSAELTHESESLSGGAVQIGNAITEKMLLDVLMAARDRGLYNAITDCGAGGFSSAVGEMGEELGAEVWLDRAPVKYEGLSYTEIWISEAQERMVLSVSPRHWDQLNALCQSEGVEATIIGRFGNLDAQGRPRLLLKYHDQSVADLEMEFLHGGRPKVVREAVYTPRPEQPLTASPDIKEIVEPGNRHRSALGGNGQVEMLHLATESAAMAVSSGGEYQLSDQSDTPIERLTHLIITEAVQLQATEIHIEPTQNVVQIHFRIEGALIKRDSPPRRLLEAILSRLKIMANMVIDERHLVQKGHIKVAVGEKAIDIDVSMLPTNYGQSCVLRLLNKEIIQAKGASSQTHDRTLLAILGSLNVASKEWVIRQYDHEVQGGSVVKSLVGAANDGPSDAAVIRPVLASRRGLVIACGMNPRYGDFDPYHMAASAIDEAVRNCVAVGADPARIAILDNFCWGDCEKPETLGSLVRAALACHDVAVALGTPFISGKDSLNNEFSFVDSAGQKQTIAIPPTLLISALGQIDDVGRAVTMDLKEPGNLLYQVGYTYNELGGSHYALVHNISEGRIPRVDPAAARRVFAALHRAIDAGLVRACHDLSEGGLAVAATEMAFAGGLGLRLELNRVWAAESRADDITGLFSESNTRFLCEVRPDQAPQFENRLQDAPVARIGEVVDSGRLQITGVDETFVIDLPLSALKEAWQAPLRW